MKRAPSPGSSLVANWRKSLAKRQLSTEMSIKVCRASALTGFELTSKSAPITKVRFAHEIAYAVIAIYGLEIFFFKQRSFYETSRIV